MNVSEELKKQIRFLDLALAAGRKRQSPRTGFVHLHLSDETISDTIPVYENFCFAFALFRQKTAEAVKEGKELIDRLLSFQAPNGNFPVYLHDYPRCWDFLMPLKIAPILIHLLDLFDAILGPDLKIKMEACLQKLKENAELRRFEKPYSLLWENRFHACMGSLLVPIDPSDFSPQDWAEWILTLQIAGRKEICSIPYNTELEAYIDPSILQEKGEPRPSPIEWLLAGEISSARLLKDHPHQLYCAPLFPIEFVPLSDRPFSPTSENKGNFRLLWKGESLHTLISSPASKILAQENKWELYFDLNQEIPIAREDLFEIDFFTDFSPETELFIEGRKGTVFHLGDTLSIETPVLSIKLKFEQVSGEGDFCGHISRGNRPNQIGCKGATLYEAYDWRIGLRTLRRSSTCQICAKVEMTLNPQ